MTEKHSLFTPLKDTVDAAQDKVLSLEEEAQKRVRSFFERSRAIREEQFKKIEEFLNILNNREFVERIQQSEVFKNLAELGRQFAARIGLATKRDIETIATQIDELKQMVEQIDKRAKTTKTKSTSTKTKSKSSAKAKK